MARCISFLPASTATDLPVSKAALPTSLAADEAISFVAVAVVAVVYLHDITTYINIREISQMNHANKDLKEVKNL